MLSVGASSSNGFQFTPLREGRHFSLFLGRFGFAFQFTPLREGRRDDDEGEGRSEGFNSRPCVRGDSTRPNSTSHEVFQFTPLREGRQRG